MKKKTLLIILLIPFLLAILGFANIVLVQNFVTVDLDSINIKFDENTGFKIREEPYKLEAEGVYDKNMKLSEGNDLKWYVAEEDRDKNICSVSEGTNKTFYLNALNEGTAKIFCSNEKGTVSADFKAHVYADGVIVINPVAAGNGQNISKTRAYGTTDLEYKDGKVSKTDAEVKVNIKTYPESRPQQVKLVRNETSNFIRLNDTNDGIIIDKKLITSKEKSIDAKITLCAATSEFVKGTYTFRVINDGVNVYDYNDLLNCTNNSKTGEIVCLQTNLECLENTYQKDESGKFINQPLEKNKNTKLFGNFDFKSQKTNFAKEVYTFDSNYNTKFINQSYKNKPGKADDVIAGIHVQQDFYGNGFVINGRELTYPNNGKIDEYSGKLTPDASKGDLFNGPLTFVSIGLFDVPIIKAFGQDNSLMYVTGHDILLDDLNIKNTHRFDNTVGSDLGRNNIYNLEYTGSCVDVCATNVTLQNSRLRNARNVLRVYSSNGFTLKNSVLENAREFLMKIGNNELLETRNQDNFNIEFAGRSYNGEFGKFMNNPKPTSEKDLNGQTLIEPTLFPPEEITANPDAYLAKLHSLQSALDNVTEDGNVPFAQNVIIEDSYFYQSGIFSIAFDTYFNGPFLYNGVPLKYSEMFKQFEQYFGNLVYPDQIAGVMLPTNLTIKGDTRFYDWKSKDTIDASCLIEERLGDLLSALGKEGKIGIDQYFPMKYALSKEAALKNYTYNVAEDGANKTYINTPIAWYGGGLNLSEVNYEGVSNMKFGDELDVDIARLSITGEGIDSSTFPSLLARCVSLAAGYHSFKFITNGNYKGVPQYFGEVPQIEDLKQRA